MRDEEVDKDGERDGVLAQHDLRLVHSLRRRDIGAFRTLYNDFREPLSRFLLNMLRRPHMVDEVLDDTMMVVWRSIDRFESRSRLSTWIYGIAYRQALTALRRHDEPVEDDPERPGDGADASPERHAGEEQARSRLLAAIDTLSPVHRAVINLTYFHDMGYREIAAIMDCPDDTVKTRMFHARRQLRQRLTGNLDDWI